MVYNHSPQLLEARQRGAAPDVYHHYRRKAAYGKTGAYAMWFICLSLGGAFTILTYDIPGLSPLINNVIVLFIWAVVTLLIGVGTEKIVEFGLEINANSPFSVTKAIRGILVCGLVIILSFAGLLLLRTLISLPLLIALQAIFEVSAISAGSFFKAIEGFYSVLPDLRDRITSLEDSISKIDAQLAILDSSVNTGVQSVTVAKRIEPHSSLKGEAMAPSDLIERHSFLVDKKYLEGLLDAETEELNQINKLLDAYDAPFYKPIIERLTDLHEQLVAHSQVQPETNYEPKSGEKLPVTLPSILQAQPEKK